MPEETQPVLPGDGFPDGPGRPAFSASVPGPGTPAHRASLTFALFAPTPRTPAPSPPPAAPPSSRTPGTCTDAPFSSDPVLDEVLDWEMEALSREDDPYRSYCEEGEARDEDERLEESYLLAAPGTAGPEQFAVGAAADAMAPGPVLAILADRVQGNGLERLDDDQLTGVLQAAVRLASGRRR